MQALALIHGRGYDILSLNEFKVSISSLADI
jgi:hypothetical protein